MANTRVYTESVVTLNNQEALARIEELKKKAEELRLEMYRVGQAKGINSKEFRQLQKEYIGLLNSTKSINEEHKKFEKILNNINGSTYNELAKAAKMLEGQVRKLAPGTEQFVASSKKLKEVRTRMKEIDGQTRETQQRFGTFFSKIRWTALVAGAIATFKKLGKDMTEETFRVGAVWKRETAAWKASYDEFVASIGSGKGWMELIADMATAAEVARDYQTVLGDISRMKNALLIQESEYADEIQEARQRMYDTSLTAKEREEAAQTVIDKERELAEQRKVIAERQLEADTKVLEARSHMDEEERKFFIEGYNRNHELISQAYEYKAALAEVESAKRMIEHFEKGDPTTGIASKADIEQAGQYRDRLAELEDQIAGTSGEVVKAYGILQKYNQLNGEMVNNFVQASVQYNEIEANLTKTTRRATTIRNKMRMQAAQEAQAQQNKAYQDALKASDDHNKEEQNRLKQSYLAREISEAEYQARLVDLQKQGLQDRMAVAERYKQSTIEMQSQLLDLAIEQRKKLEKLIDDLAKDAAKAMEQALKEADKAFSDFIKDQEREFEDLMKESDELMDEELQHMLDLFEKAKEARTELDPLGAAREELDAELEALEEMHEKGLVSEEQYHKRRAQLAAKYGEKIADAANTYLDKATNLMDALQSAAAARLDAQMQAELTAAGDNAERRSEIEANYEAQKLELQKRYADVDMGISIAKALAAGALAVMQGFAQLGPIGGAVAAVLVGATTAAEVAMIIAQRNAIKNSSVSTGSSAGAAQMGSRTVTSDEGFSDGGYTRRDTSDAKAVGVVHANEWVAPAAMVRAMPVTFARLESERRSGNYRSGLSGFADGGATSGDLPAGSAADLGLLQDLRQLLRQLLDSLPFPAYVVLSQLNAAKEVDAKIKKTVGK